MNGASRKIDIVERKRQLAAQDPIPPEFGFGITIQVLKTYKPGRFSELQAAVERARTKIEPTNRRFNSDGSRRFVLEENNKHKGE